jgi:hypothetical protein
VLASISVCSGSCSVSSGSRSVASESGDRLRLRRRGLVANSATGGLAGGGIFTSNEVDKSLD